MTVAALLMISCTSERGFDVPAPPNPELQDPLPVQPEEQIDVVLQVIEPAVDVLWVLDNSGSMDGDRAALADAFPSFVAPFVDSSVDFHIGVITMDMGRESHRGKLRNVDDLRWLDRDTKALQDTFTGMAIAALAPDKKETGSIRLLEHGRDAIWHALGEESGHGGYNEGFLRERDSAWLHITVVTDEDDHSEEMSEGAFAWWLGSLRSLQDRVTFNSIVSLVTHAGAERGASYLDLTEEIGGHSASITDESWPELLADLGALQAPPPMAEFYLSKLPVPSTVEVRAVTVDGVTLVYEPGVAFTYDAQRNSVTFDDKDKPPAGARVEIRYQTRRT